MSDSSTEAAAGGTTILGATDDPTPATETATTANADSEAATVPASGEGEGVAETPAADAPDGEQAAEQQGGVPETYSALTLPEGFQLEGERLEAAVQFARDNGWSQEQFQAGAEKYVQMRQAEDEYTRGQLELAARDEFGERFTEVARNARRVLAAAAKERPGLMEWVATDAVGSHPHMIWLLNRFGLDSREQGLLGVDQPAGSGAPPAALADRMFPSMRK